MKRGAENLGKLAERTREMRDERDAKAYEKDKEKLNRLDERRKHAKLGATIRSREAEIRRLQNKGRDTGLFGSEPSAIDPMLFGGTPARKPRKKRSNTKTIRIVVDGPKKKSKKRSRKKKKDDDFWRL